MKKILLISIFLCLLINMASTQNSLTVCEGEQIYLVVYPPAGSTIQWQSSPDGITYSDIPFGTLDTMPAGVIQSKMFYRAEILGQQCNPYFSEIYEIDVVQNPSAAIAGVDTVVTGTSIQLYATAPAIGQGGWTILSGSNGNFNNAGLPDATFTGLLDSTYTLLWTVSNAPCNSTTDTLVVKFEDIGLPTITCNNQSLYIHPTDNAGPTSWGCSGIVAGAGSDTDGAANTALIVANCPAPTAAGVCDNLVAFGFSDWYLPAYNELDCMRNNATAIGGFSNAIYWSSTEGTGIFTANARYRTFPSGTSGYGSKSNSYRIRCVRK